MKLVGLARHAQFRAHANNAGHPESSDRLEAIERALDAATDLNPHMVALSTAEATRNQLELVHDPAYLDWFDMIGQRARAASARIQLDSDTHVNPATIYSAYLAAGSGIVAVEAIKNAHVGSTFVLVRPPGHHALRRQAMGFCLLNNVAVAARYCVRNLGYKRVLVLDWDVHHGNGTQEIFWNDPSVLLVSIQRYPQWPYCGWYTEDGGGEGRGYNVNIPLPMGTGDLGYLNAWEQVVAPVALEYRPELILLSAGYDAHELDPIGGMRVTTGGFCSLMEKLVSLASALGGVKIAAFLEGGYNPTALAESVLATMRTLAGVPVINPMPSLSVNADDRAVADYLRATRRYLGRYWKCLR